jgi:hypothetical protein
MPRPAANIFSSSHTRRMSGVSPCVVLATELHVSEAQGGVVEGQRGSCGGYVVTVSRRFVVVGSGCYDVVRVVLSHWVGSPCGVAAPGRLFVDRGVLSSRTMGAHLALDFKSPRPPMLLLHARKSPLQLAEAVLGSLRWCALHNHSAHKLFLLCDLMLRFPKVVIG